MHWKKSSGFRTIALVLFLSPLYVWGQYQISGVVIDESGSPLPFATVYDEGTTNGTTTNANGNYVLTLSAGLHKVVAQYISYQRQVKSITVSDSRTTLNFQLLPEARVLKEVVIQADQGNPARQIIRKAIEKRKFYEKEVNAYACEVYIKGLQRLDKKPDRVLGMNVKADTGIVYLSESISKMKFEQPDRINEVMISSKVSGNNNAFSYNQASDMLINLYNNNFFVEGLSERSFISPLSNNAFLYYNYQLAGVIEEDSMLINKIRIIPRRKTDPVFNGYIYIIEDSWRLHSVDVFLTKANGIEFIDSLSFRQIFAPLDYGIWMPISQRFAFKFKVLGFEGSGHFTGIYRDYVVEPNYELYRKENLYQKTFEANHDEEELFQKKDFTNAVLTVQEGANERDSTYWKNVRPIPLTEIELTDYKIKDSIKLIKESKPYKDSVDNVLNRFKVANLFLNGYTYFNSFKERYVNFPTLLEGLQYNAVEGLVANLEFSFQKRKDRQMIYQLSPSIRYGFENKQLQARVEGLRRINIKKKEFVFGGLGRYIYQFNETKPIKDFDNTYFTLVEGNNYARLYQKTFLDVGYQRELVNGVNFTGVLTYAYREPLQNHASCNFQDKPFRSNVPVNEEIQGDDDMTTDFTSHQAMVGSFRFRIRFAQRYIDRPDRKIDLRSKYPELHIAYKKGFPVFGSRVNYDLLKLGTKYTWRIGLVGESRVSAWTGEFLNTRSTYFMDFEHFNGNRTYLRQLEGEDLFQVLDYYQFSTRDRFAEIHYEHHFNEFIFNKIPFVKRLNLQAVGSINYLTTPTAGQYLEFGAGIEHIFKVLRVDYFTAIRNGEFYRSGIRIGAGF